MNAVTWTPENTVAGKTIPADAPREGTTANRPSGQYVYDNLYVGFEYHDTTINRYIFVNSMKRTGAGTTASPYVYDIEWVERPQFWGIISTDRGLMYYDRTLGKKIYVGSVNTTTGVINWVDGNDIDLSVKKAGTFAEKPSQVLIYIGFGYFCTDRKVDMDSASPTYMNIITPVSPDTGGMEIYHKGNNVWVDALGRVVS